MCPCKIVELNAFSYAPITSMYIFLNKCDIMKNNADTITPNGKMSVLWPEVIFFLSEQHEYYRRRWKKKKGGSYLGYPTMVASLEGKQ